MMLLESICAAELLKEKGISASVLNMHTIKSLDIAAIRNAYTRSNLIVTVEEHSIIGGLGCAVAECLSETAGSPDSYASEFRMLSSMSGITEISLSRMGFPAPRLQRKLPSHLVRTFGHDDRN